MVWVEGVWVFEAWVLEVLRVSKETPGGAEQVLGVELVG